MSYGNGCCVRASLYREVMAVIAIILPLALTWKETDRGCEIEESQEDRAGLFGRAGYVGDPAVAEGLDQSPLVKW